MKTLYFLIITASGMGVAVALGLLIIGGTMNMSPTASGHDIPARIRCCATHSLLYFAMSLNGTPTTNQFIQLHARQGQNITLAVEENTDTKALPWSVSISPRNGFPMANGISWAPKSQQVGNTSSTRMFKISVGGNVTPGSYPMEVDADTMSKPYMPFGWAGYFDLVVSPANDGMPQISKVSIPAGSEDPDSGKNFEPQYLVVVLGVNNTVKWTNKSPAAARTIVAESQDDPLFWNATRLANNALLLPGKSFNFTFTKVGEFRYGTEPHPWMAGWVTVLPQSAQNAIQTVTLNASSGIPDPCETFRVPCPLHAGNYNFTAQKFGPDIYIEKFTGNGVDYYAIIKHSGICYYPSTSSDRCKNPDDLAILRLVGVDTSIPQEYADIVISGLKPKYAAGEPISFELRMNGYGYDACEIPYVSVLGHNGSLVWQSNKTPWISCTQGRGYHDTVFGMNTLGGPFSINQSGTYAIRVDYTLNSTYAQFDVVDAAAKTAAGHVAYTRGNDSFGIIALVVYHPPTACLGPCLPNTFYLKINSATAAYLQGYNICDGSSCTAGNDLSVSLPVNDITRPDFAMIPLPTDLKWKYGYTVRIQASVSPTAEDKDASLIDYGNSTIVP